MTNLTDQISWTRINNDVNGNPRYVCHYLSFMPYGSDEPFSYEDALKLAKTIGGRKFHNKQYGGDIVFQSYNTYDLAEQVLLLSGYALRCYREPTAGEIKFGHGAIHYRSFLTSDILNRKGNLKKWFKCNDGLRYSTK